MSKFAIALLSEIKSFNILSDELLLKGSGIFYSYNSIFVYPASVALFVFFLNVNVRNQYLKNVILFFFPLTLGVYLIHDNKYMRTVLWNYVNAPIYIPQWYFPILMIAIIISIYIICSFIEKSRKILFNPIEQSEWLDKLCVRLTNVTRL